MGIDELPEITKLTRERNEYRDALRIICGAVSRLFDRGAIGVDWPDDPNGEAEVQHIADVLREELKSVRKYYGFR